VIDVAGFAITFLLFPTGRLLTPLAIGGLAAGRRLRARVPGQALSPDNPDNPLPMDNAMVHGILDLGLLLLLSPSLLRSPRWW
jgi:hypothetical protein